MLDANGKPYGALIDIYREINQKLGINIQWEIGPWKDIVARVRQGELDGFMMACNDQNRGSNQLPTSSILEGYAAVYGRKDSNIRIDSL